MFNLIMADLFKLRKSLYVKLLFIITVISSAAMCFIAYGIQHGKLASKLSGIGFMFSDVNIIGILGAVIAGIFICGDFDNKIIHDAIASGSSRGTIIISKAIAFFCSILFILLPYVLAIFISFGTGSKFSLGSKAVGFLHLLTVDGGMKYSSTDILKLLVLIFSMIIVYLSQLSICVPLALVFKKPVIVAAIYYALSILCAQLSALNNSSTIFANIFACTPFGGNYAFLTLNTTTIYILRTLLVSLFFAILMLILANFSFKKAEIK